MSETPHVLDRTATPCACSCGRARFAGSPTFVRKQHAEHVAQFERSAAKDLEAMTPQGLYDAGYFDGDDMPPADTDPPCVDPLAGCHRVLNGVPCALHDGADQ